MKIKSLSFIANQAKFRQLIQPSKCRSIFAEIEGLHQSLVLIFVEFFKASLFHPMLRPSVAVFLSKIAKEING